MSAMLVAITTKCTLNCSSQQDMIAQQGTLMLQMIEKLNERITRQEQDGAEGESSRQSANPTARLDRLKESITRNVLTDFIYDSESNLTFKLWFAKYKDLFNEDGKDLDSATRVRILLRKLGTREHQQFIAHILPKEPKDFTFDEIIKVLETRFGLKESTFRSRFLCLRAAKNSSEDYFTYIGRINTLIQKMDFSTMTEDQFKCVLFIVGLNSSEESDVREKLLEMMERNQETEDSDASKLTIDKLVIESQRFVSLRSDNKEIEKLAPPHMVQAIKQRGNFSNPTNSHKPMEDKQPSRPCGRCGASHWESDCYFKDKECFACEGRGHKSGFCAFQPTQHSDTFKKKTKDFSSIKAVYSKRSMTRKFVKVIVRDKPLKLQLDTASDGTFISYSSWKYLGSLKLSATAQHVVTATSEPVKYLGFFRANIKHDSTAIQGNIFVTPYKSLNVIGNDFITKFKWWSTSFDKICCNKLQLTSRDKQRQPAVVLEHEIQRELSGEIGHCERIKPKLTWKSDETSVISGQRNSQLNRNSTKPKPQHRPNLLKSKKDSEVKKISQNTAFIRKRAGRNRFKQHEKIFIMLHENNNWKWQKGVIVKPSGSDTYIVDIYNNRKTTQAHASQLRHDTS